MSTASKKLIRGGWIVTGDQELGILEDADLLIEGDRISVIGHSIDPSGAEIIDAGGMIVMPGFVDTHKHTWQSAIRHRCTNIDLNTYFGEMFAVRGGRYTAEDVYIGNLLGAAAALEAGTTTLMDWSHIQNSPEHSDAAIDALEAAGIRAIFGHGWPCVDLLQWIMNSDRPHTADVRRIRKTRLSNDEGLVTLQLGGRGPELSTLDTSRADLRMARELGIRTSIHMGCGCERGKMAAITRLHEAGLLGPDLNFVHCSECSEDEFRMMADHGVTASISPQHEFVFAGIGYSPIDRLQAFGIRTGLSTDTETAGAGDMFVQMRALLAAQRSIVNEGRSKLAEPPAPMTSAEAFRMATLGGAEALGMDHRIGKLVPGYQADVILVRATDLNLFPVTDPVAAVVAAAHPGNVDTVIVAGQVRKRNGQLCGIDIDRLMERALASHDRLLTN